MEIQPGTPTAKGRPDSFTGEVWIDGIAQGHAIGQTLHVTDDEYRA